TDLLSRIRLKPFSSNRRTNSLNVIVPTPGRPETHANGCRAEAKESQEITRGPSGVLGSRCVGTGRRSEHRDPLPGTLSTSMVPPWASTIFRVVGRPRPLPPGRVE